MSAQKPRIGIPYRSASEEQAGKWGKIRPYVAAIEAAGGEPRLISLLHPEKLAGLVGELDGFLLPGSSVDVNPALYGETRRPETGEADPMREQTDQALLRHAFQENKPVLSICYGTQMLNVFRGGTLVQDIPSEIASSRTHPWDREAGAPEPHHAARLVPGSRVASLARMADVVVNSSHHQSIRQPGSGLRVTATAPDGVVESVELDDRSHWVTGVQWHPERQREETPGQDDSGIQLANALFRDLVRVAAQGHAKPRVPANNIHKTDDPEEQ